MFWDKVHTTNTATQITQNKWDKIGTAGCKHVLGQNSNNTSQQQKSHTTVMTTLGQLVANMFWDKVHTAKHSNKNQTEQLRHIWDCWLQTRFGTKLTQQITATQITHNYWDTIGTVGCKHVLGQNSNNTSRQQKSHTTVGTKLGQSVANMFCGTKFTQQSATQIQITIGTILEQSVANMFWDKFYTTTHSNTNQTNQVGCIWDSWLQTRFGTTFSVRVPSQQSLQTCSRQWRRYIDRARMAGNLVQK